MSVVVANVIWNAAQSYKHDANPINGRDLNRAQHLNEICISYSVGWRWCCIYYHFLRYHKEIYARYMHWSQPQKAFSILDCKISTKTSQIGASFELSIPTVTFLVGIFPSSMLRIFWVGLLKSYSLSYTQFPIVNETRVRLRVEDHKVFSLLHLKCQSS